MLSNLNEHDICRVVEEYMLYVGGSIGYWQGDVKKLMDDLGALRPTIFVGVPRVFERICGGINDMVSGANTCWSEILLPYVLRTLRYGLTQDLHWHRDWCAMTK